MASLTSTQAMQGFGKVSVKVSREALLPLTPQLRIECDFGGQTAISDSKERAIPQVTEQGSESSLCP